MATGHYWSQATDLFRTNQNPGTKLSIGAGFFGADGFASCDLGGGRSAFFAGDSFIATGAGQEGPLGGTAAPNSTFISNTVHVTDNYDLSLATLTSHWKLNGSGAPASFFPDIMVNGTPCFRYPHNGVLLDDILVVTGLIARQDSSIYTFLDGDLDVVSGDFTINVESTEGFRSAGTITTSSRTITYTGRTFTSFTGCTLTAGATGTIASGTTVTQAGGGFGFFDTGNWASVISNPGDSPGSWIETRVPCVGDNYTRKFGFGGPGMHDIDGYVYAFGQGPGPDGTAMRLLRTEMKAGRLIEPEFWDADTGWRKDRRNSTERVPNGDRSRLRGGLFGWTPQSGIFGTNPSGFSVHQRSDGKWQKTGIFHAPIFGGNGMGYTLTPGSDLEPFPQPVDVYDPDTDASQPVGTNDFFIYSGFAHKQLTWSGAGANDQVWSYSVNNSDSTQYFPKFLKVTDVT